MAKKKKKKSSSTLISASILLIALCLVWGLSSCGKDPKIISKETTQEQGKEATDNEESENGGQDILPVNENNEETDVVDTTNEEEEPVVEAVDEVDLEQSDEVGDVNDQNVDETVAEGASDEDHFDSSMDIEKLSNENYSWSWKRNSNHEPVVVYNQGIDLSSFGAYYQVETDEKVVYLTFDEGYENGFTSQILDILKDNDVKATFFVTEPYIKNSLDLCIRMKEEGHLVGNHSSTHSSFPELTDEETINELLDTRTTFEELTGYEMDPFFRFPSGKFSERALYIIRNEGYRIIFWSLGYGDWDVKNQPGVEYAYNHIMENYHPGGIFLLHAVSESTTGALDKTIKALKEEGYRFGSLYEVE